jgi:hypothetical protein
VHIHDANDAHYCAVIDSFDRVEQFVVMDDSNVRVVATYHDRLNTLSNKILRANLYVQDKVI